MSEAMHTKGPWSNDDGDISGQENDPANGCVGPVDVCHVYMRTVPGRAEANATRIVTCVNAMEGLTNAQVAGLRKSHADLLAVARAVQRIKIVGLDANEYDLDALDDAINAARAAIAKATGAALATAKEAV